MSKSPRFFALLLIAGSSLALSACMGPVALMSGVGATAGVAAAKEGGLKGSLDDTRIRGEISDKWFKYKYDTFAKLNLEVNQGRVLITGVVPLAEDRVEAVRLAWTVKGVKQVINEARVGKSGGLEAFARDNWINTQIRSKLIMNRDVQSINYSIVTVQGSVYLMGVAQNQAELDRVIRIAKKVPGVKEVISYVKLLGQPVEATSSMTGSSMSDIAPAAGQPVMPAPVYQNPGYEQQPPQPVFGGSAPMAVTPPSSSPSGIQSEVLPP